MSRASRLEYPGRRLVYGLVCAGFLALLPCGCTVWKTRPVIPMEERSAARVLAIINANAEKLDHLKGRGRMTLEMSGRSMTLDAHIIMNRPDTLYIRLEALFGLDVGWLFVDKERYTLFNAMQNTYASGAIDSLPGGALPGFEVDVSHFLGSLTGLESARNMHDLQMSRDEDGLAVEGLTALGRQKHWMDRSRGVVVRSESYDSTGAVLLQAAYERFSRINGVQVPRTIRLKRPPENQSITIFYQQLQINEALSAKDFKLKIPANARRIDL